MANNIKIYSTLKSGKVAFDGARVSNKEIGSLEVLAHPTLSNRIIIKSNRQFKRGSDTEFRVFFSKLNINRIQNEAGENLTEAPYNMDRDAVISYVHEQITKPIVTEYFEYNPATDRLVAQKDIEVQKNGFFLGGKHKMASGNSNIYFEDLDNKANAYPIFGEVLDQSLSINQVAGAGVTKPKSRIFGDFQSVPLGGSPVNDTSIPYDGNNFFPFNISGVGITTRVAEVVLPTQQLKYEIVINGISVYVQYLEHNGLAINEDLTWYFEQPLDVENGTTLRATIYKVSTVNNQEQNDGILLVCEGDDVNTRYQTNVLSRFFEDEEIALKSDVDQLLSGSTYKGAYDALNDSPSLPTGSDVLGDFYRVSVAGNGANVGDIKVFNGTTYDLISEENATQSDIKNSGLKIYDIYVKAGYLGTVQDGSVLYPYGDLTTAIGSTNDGDSIYLEGSFEIASEITLPQDKSLYFYGSDDACISFTNYSDGNGSLLYFDGLDNTKEFKFRNIKFHNAGGYGLYLKKTAKITIEDCEFKNNGWNGTALNTILPSTTTALLGYDSSSVDLQAFYAGSNASNGGAMRIQEATQILITGNTITNNLRGLRVQDCGINGGGVISRNQSTQNIESGIYIAAGSLGGCQNITTTMNVSAYNANNGLLVIGGLNNKFSQNEVNGNWNAGFCAWGAGNTTLRDCGLYDNNRSEFNGIGNTGDAKASIQINEAYNLLGTNISLNPNFRFIAEILDTQVHYTGLGSNTEKIGFLITSAVGNLPINDKNIIKVDDVGFIGQDYAIDFSEVDLTNLHVAIGDNSFMSIGEKAVRQPSIGSYYELPFSNHVTKVNYADFSIDSTGNIKVTEGVNGARINPYQVNDLQAIADGTEIRVILKDSKKVQFNVPVAGCSIDGSFVNSVLNQAVIQLNNIFTNTDGFASGGGNPVTNFQLVGDDLTLTLEDLTSFTVDVTTLGVDENNFVVSGALSGSDLVLTMTDGSEVTIDASNMINGSTLPALSAGWYIASTDALVTSNKINNSIRNFQPFYNGTLLDKGTEFLFNNEPIQGFTIGVYDENGNVPTTGADGQSSSNWTTSFRFQNISGTTYWSAADSQSIDLTSDYTMTNDNAPMILRYTSDNYLKLIEVLANGDEVLIATSSVQQVGDSLSISFAGWSAGSVFPTFIKRSENWTIVHDFDNSENGIYNNIEDHTVIRSNVQLSQGEKYMINLTADGRSNYFGTDYVLASSGNANAETSLDNRFTYGLSEQLLSGSDWTLNTSAVHYDANLGAGAWRANGNGNPVGMISMRYQDNNVLELWSEEQGELIMTCDTLMDGSPIHLYYGVRENTLYQHIPTVSKQTIGQGIQPITTYAPNVPDQVFYIEEGGTLNAQLIVLDYIVNQWVEIDAPNWITMNQNTGVLSGVAPSWTNSAADAIVINCKAANAIGGTTNFTATVNVYQTSYTNSQSIRFDAGQSSYFSGNATNVSALQRTGNGDDANKSINDWSISMWVKLGDNTGNPYFAYGSSNNVDGYIELRETADDRLRLRYGTSSSYLQLSSSANTLSNGWNHVMVTYDGGATDNYQFGAFTIFINGVAQTTSNSVANNGFGGDIGTDFMYVGRFSNTYLDNGHVDQLAIWNSDKSADIATIYNSGTPQDLGWTNPNHYYEFGDSIITAQDREGNANLTGFNLNTNDMVTDVPS